MSRIPFGESASLQMFMRFSIGSVTDVALQGHVNTYTASNAITIQPIILGYVEAGHTVGDSTDESVAVWREEQIALGVHCAAQIPELHTYT